MRIESKAPWSFVAKCPQDCDCEVCCPELESLRLVREDVAAQDAERAEYLRSDKAIRECEESIARGWVRK